MTIRHVNEKGFTIQELLVVLFVGSLLLSFSLSLLLFSGKLFGSWERDLELHRTAHRVVHRLSSDLRKSDRLEVRSDSALVLQLLDERSVEYRFSIGKITRNGVYLSAEDSPLLWATIADSTIFHITAESRGKEYALQTRLAIPHSSHSDIMYELLALREDSSWEVSKKH